jgi:hypothetical protein
MSEQATVKYQDPKSLLVVNSKGILRVLYVPFTVKCIQPVKNIPVNTTLYVEGVYLHRKYLLVYHINQSMYPYVYFRIDLSH